jgi:hypothetical protein
MRDWHGLLEIRKTLKYHRRCDDRGKILTRNFQIIMQGCFPLDLEFRSLQRYNSEYNEIFMDG